MPPTVDTSGEDEDVGDGGSLVESEARHTGETQFAQSPTKRSRGRPKSAKQGNRCEVNHRLRPCVQDYIM